MPSSSKWLTLLHWFVSVKITCTLIDDWLNYTSERLKQNRIELFFVVGMGWGGMGWLDTLTGPWPLQIISEREMLKKKFTRFSHLFQSNIFSLFKTSVWMIKTENGKFHILFVHLFIFANIDLHNWQIYSKPCKTFEALTMSIR